jgi:hypothetical protein
MHVRKEAESDQAGPALWVHDLLQQNLLLPANLLVERTG